MPPEITTLSLTLAVELTDEQAQAFAQFLKRARLDTFRDLAASDREASLMQYTAERLKKAFAAEGYAPR